MSRWLTAGVLTLAVGLAPAAGETPEALVKTIRGVKAEGEGSPAAAKAWKALAGMGAEALFPILAGVSDDEPRAANWLRSAFDAAAGRAQAAGKLPKAALEKFVLERKNAPLARRLAYEWVVRADAGAPERLLPGMLKDASPDLRRDAVERLLKAGEASEKAGDKDGAKASFQEALTGACDPDQVEELAKALDKLGVRVDQQKHFGFIARWHLAAPFDHTGRKGWAVAYPPEKGVDLKATYKGKDDAEVKWQEASTDDPHGLIDLNKELKNYKGAIAYAFAVVESPREQDVWLRVGCINGLKMFVNGKQVFGCEEYHHGMSIDQYKAAARLKAGKNEILLKVCQNEQTEKWAQNWRFQLRLTDFTGSAAAFTLAGKEGK